MPHSTRRESVCTVQLNGHTEQERLRELVEAQQKCAEALRQALEQFGEYLRHWGAGGRDSYGQDLAGMQYTLFLYCNYLEGQLPDPGN